MIVSALTLLVGRQEGHAACRKTEWWGADVVICLEQGADLHMVQLMPLPLTVSCFSKIQTGFAFLVPAHPGSSGQRAVKRVCGVCYLLRTGWTTSNGRRATMTRTSNRKRTSSRRASSDSTNSTNISSLYLY